MEDEELAGQILEIALKNKPQTVEELVRSVQQISKVPKERIVSCILKLQENGKISSKLGMEKEKREVSSSFARFLKSTNALWFWTVVISASFLLMMILLFGSDQTTLYVVVRQILGGAFIILYPGFSFVKAISPSKKSSLVEVVVFSLAFSFAFTAIIGFILNYTPFGINTVSTVTSLYALILLFSSVGIVREYFEK